MNRPGPSRRTWNNPASDSTGIAGSFGAFLEQWLIRQEGYLDELRLAAENRHTTPERELVDLIDRVLSHYERYNEEKSRTVHENVFVMFSPPWLTRLERTFLWVAGFKPGLLVELALSSVGLELTEDQAQRMEVLRARTREREINNEMARLQESVACPPILGATRRCARLLLQDGVVDEETGVMEALRAGMETAAMNADVLRMRTAMGVIEILNPGQRVKFLADATELQLKLRSSGLQRDAEEGG